MFRHIGVVLTAMLLVSCSRVPRAERLLVGGVVHLPEGPREVAVAISDGRILSLVPASETNAWRRRAAEVVDLAGAHVYAGFTESHGHLVGYGAALEQVDLRGAESFEEVIRRVSVAAQGLPAGAWVQGRGWDQNLWAEKTFPHHAALSRAVPDHPVRLGRVDGHAVLTNAAGLAAAGITAATPQVPGGEIVRDASGEPTGVLVDAAEGLLERVVPAPSAADLERRIERGSRELASFGFTEIHDAGTGRESLAALRRLRDEGRLPIRVYCMLDGTDEALLDEELRAGVQASRDGMLTVRAVKLYADGALGSRGAWLSAPYADRTDTRGLQVSSEEALTEAIRKAARASFQPCVHAIGDAAVRRTLDLYDLEVANRTLDVRPRIEHAQIVRPEDVSRFDRLGVLAAVQPVHCISDMPWAPERLGEERIGWAYRWRSLLDAGARLSLGSDVPVESPDPRIGLWAATTRRPQEGTPQGWNEAEAMTLAEAIEGYTAWAAWAGFEEDWRGRVTPGYAADLTVFDAELTPATILQARVVRTIVAGRDAFVPRSEP